MMNVIRKKLCEKDANGTLYLGIVIMIVAFVVVLVCVNLFQMYTTHARAQLICDTIADGAAVAGQTTNGYFVDRAISAAEEIFQKNKIDGTLQNYSINITNDYDDNGQYTGYKLITVTYSLSTRAYGTSFLNNYSSNTLSSHYTANAKAVVKAKATIQQNTWITSSYALNPNAPLPFPTTTPGARAGGYATWLIDYHLCPQQNTIYTLGGDHEAYCLLFDYLKCMAVPVEGWRNAASLRIMHNNYTSGIFDTSIWTEMNNPETIQMAADTGKPTIILCKENLTGDYQCYIVVPQKNAIAPGHITVAYANWFKCSNYDVLDWNDFCSKHSNIIAITTS